MVEGGNFALRWERWQQRWDEFNPSKAAWLWSCLGSAVLTVAVGFTVCGWLTRAQADIAAAQAASLARADLVAKACLWNIANGSDLTAWLASLRETDETARANTPLEKAVISPAALAGSASLCTDELATKHSPDGKEPKG